MPTRTSGDSPLENPPRRTAGSTAGAGRHSAEPRHAAPETSPQAGRHSAEAPTTVIPTVRPTRAESRRAAATPDARAGEHRAAGATRARTGRRRLKPVLAAVLLIAAASVVVQVGVKVQWGTGDSASAALASQFTVANGAIRKATGTPVPTTGSQASLWSGNSTATTVIEGSGRVLIGAIGDPCGGWPTVEGTVDGKRLGATTIVSASQYGTYGVGPGTLPAGTHKVVLRFVNDRYDPPACDRNVHVGYARMEFPANAGRPAPGPAPTTGAPIPTLNPPAPPAPTTPKPSSPAPTTTTSAPAPPPPAPNPPSPGGKPGPANTGVPDGTKLTVHNGDLTVSKDGTVIDGLEIKGYLKINASNVTVRNTMIRGGVANGPGFSALVSAYGDHRNFVIEDSTLIAANPSGYMDGLKGRNFTARRVDISNVVDTALVFGDNVTVEDSWFHGNRHYTPWPSAPDNQTHNDSLQIQGGTNIKVRNNTFEGSQNTAMMITQDYSRTSNVEVSGNWLSGGQCTVNLSEKGKGPIANFRVINNKFGKQGISGCAVIAPASSNVTMSGNVWEATGQPVSISKGR